MIISVTLVLVFGEIIPSALFTGPSQLLTAAFMTKFVYFLLALFYPIALPISLLLDYIFGKENSDGNISRNELEALVMIQGSEYKRSSSFAEGQSPRSYRTPPDRNTTASTPRSLSPSHMTGLSDLEVSLMTGILKLSRKSAQDAMIPIDKVYMMSSSMRLNHNTLLSILDSGFSRIPIYKRRDKKFLLGYLLVKELAVINPEEDIMIEELTLRKPLFVRLGIGLLELLHLFQGGRSHLAVISANPVATAKSFSERRRQEKDGAILGIVTLEDVLEKIIQLEISDETDRAHRASPVLLYQSGLVPSTLISGKYPASHYAGLHSHLDGSDIQEPLTKHRPRPRHVRRKRSKRRNVRELPLHHVHNGPSSIEMGTGIKLEEGTKLLRNSFSFNSLNDESSTDSSEEGEHFGLYSRRGISTGGVMVAARSLDTLSEAEEPAYKNAKQSESIAHGNSQQFHGVLRKSKGATAMRGASRTPPISSEDNRFVDEDGDCEESQLLPSQGVLNGDGKGVRYTASTTVLNSLYGTTHLPGNERPQI